MIPNHLAFKRVRLVVAHRVNRDVPAGNAPRRDLIDMAVRLRKLATRVGKQDQVWADAAAVHFDQHCG